MNSIFSGTLIRHNVSAISNMSNGQHVLWTKETPLPSCFVFVLNTPLEEKELPTRIMIETIDDTLTFKSLPVAH